MIALLLNLAIQSQATVVSVGDGDTLRVSSNSVVTTVRLGCVDAPETRQVPYGQMSRDRLRQLLPVGTPVQLREISRDRYGRVVAEVYVQGISINLQLVEEGYAVVYRQYLRGCDREQYLAAEGRARAARRNFWNQDNPVYPWDFRRRKP